MRSLFLRLLGVFFTAALLQPTMSFAVGESRGGGGQEGGGGGYVHDRFIAYGNRVLFYLWNHPEGKRLSERHNLNLCRLKQTIRDNHVFVFENEQKPMLDHRGSVVNAYTYKWKIHLAQSDWQKFFQDDTDIYHLVFKEMLRSENTHFDAAMEISKALLPFPKDYQLAVKLSRQNQKALQEFEETLQTDPASCLNLAETLEVRDVQSSYSLLSEYKFPECQIMGAGNTIAEHLIDRIQKTKCEVSPSRCRISEEKVRVGYFEVGLKSIFWKGTAIFSVPFYQKDTQTGEVETAADGFFKVFLDQKLNELTNAGVCSETPKFNAISQTVPQVGVIVDHLATGILNVEFLRQDIPKGYSGLKENLVGVLGLNSEVQLLERKAYLGYAGARFIKVRVLKNTIDSFKDMRAAKPGDEGFVILSLTNYIFYFHEPSGLLVDLQN